MRVGRLIEILQQFNKDAYVFMTFDGFENKYWIEAAVLENGGVSLIPTDNLEYSDICGAAKLLKVDDLTEAQVEAVDYLVRAEEWKIRDIKEGRL